MVMMIGCIKQADEKAAIRENLFDWHVFSLYKCGSLADAFATVCAWLELFFLRQRPNFLGRLTRVHKALGPSAYPNTRAPRAQ